MKKREKSSCCNFCKKSLEELDCILVGNDKADICEECLSIARDMLAFARDDERTRAQQDALGAKPN